MTLYSMTYVYFNYHNLITKSTSPHTVTMKDEITYTDIQFWTL